MLRAENKQDRRSAYPTPATSDPEPRHAARTTARTLVRSKTDRAFALRRATIATPRCLWNIPVRGTLVEVTCCIIQGRMLLTPSQALYWS